MRPRADSMTRFETILNRSVQGRAAVSAASVDMRNGEGVCRRKNVLPGRGLRLGDLRLRMTERHLRTACPQSRGQLHPESSCLSLSGSPRTTDLRASTQSLWWPTQLRKQLSMIEAALTTRR